MNVFYSPSDVSFLKRTFQHASVLTDSAEIYLKPNPNTGTRNSRGELSERFPDSWTSVIGAAAIAVAGSGYHANDLVTLNGGNGLASVRVLTVNGSGGALTVALVVAGALYTVKTYAAVGGAGTGLTIAVSAFSFPCRVVDENHIGSERVGAGQVQAESDVLIKFKTDVSITEQCRVKLTASRDNPFLVGNVYDVTESPDASLQALQVARCTITRPTASNPV